MNGSIRLALTISLLGLAALLYAKHRPNDKAGFDAPGQTWIRSSPFEGQEIRLLDSGAFVARDSSDVTLQESTRGTWSRQADRFRFLPAGEDKAALVLRMSTVGGCPALVKAGTDAKSEPVHPYTAYFLQSSSCRVKL